MTPLESSRLTIGILQYENFQMPIIYVKGDFSATAHKILNSAAYQRTDRQDAMCPIQD